MKDLLFRNWQLKVISLALAVALWAAVGRVPTSEIGVSVPLEFRNIPPSTEVFDDTASLVEIRLRGPSSLLRGLSSQDVSLSVDVSVLAMGVEKVVPLNAELVHAPFGIDVVGVRPAHVRLTIEPIQKKTMRVEPTLQGMPAEGFEVEAVSVDPAMAEVQGPASHIRALEVLRTTAIDLRDRQATFEQSADLDIPDPFVGVPKATPVQVEVRIRKVR